MKQHIYYFFIPALLMFFVAYLIQMNIIFSGDVGYLMHVAKQMLAGGKYAQDFFETNPPMIIYLYSPIIFIAKWASINVIDIARIYFFLMILASVSACYWMIQKIIDQQDTVITYAVTYSILFVLLILPWNEFGQREHFLLMFIFPYLFSIILLLKNKNLPAVARFFIGVFAGVGFAFKPFFLVTLALIEFYLMVRKRNIFSWIRVESLTIISVLVIYLTSIFIYQPNYINTMLPLLANFYFVGTRESFDSVISRWNVLYCFSILVCAILLNQKKRYQDLVWIVTLTLIGFIIAFLIPLTPWIVHVLPAFGLATVLAAYYFGELIASIQTKFVVLRKADYVTFILLGSVLFYTPVILSFKQLQYLYLEKKYGALTKLISYIQAMPGQHSVACFSAGTTQDCFPLVYATKSTYGMRFPFYWWIRGVLKLEGYPEAKHVLSATASHAEQYLNMQMVVDFNHFQPRFAVINTYDASYYVGKHFDYIDFFSRSEKFRDVWRHYRYLTTIDYYQVFERVA